MPSGKTHLRIELLLFPVFVTLFYLLIDVSSSAVALFAGAYLFSSLMLSPDLDLRYNQTRRRWGLLGFVWIPYTKIFKHRGVSHSVLFGPLTRLCYLGLIAVFMAWGLSYFKLWSSPIAQLVSSPLDLRLVGILASGLWLPNILHTVVDHLHSILPRRRRRSYR